MHKTSASKRILSLALIAGVLASTAWAAPAAPVIDV
jgi:hypothetical protein